ncbi:MAG: hypothetical protein WBA88_22445 [Pseudaminobacter sp.]|uniref:Uncharacterized protein n=1 Tax=Aquamicrobium defluvii TaxID=69279 RepID=A0A4R6YFH3_9HYPH|nr:hypothetical protein [Aquamicrobium defluvii]TDR34899.1 hypothetical protein DES43_112111 [Aquamicrobium defluvii]
MLLTVFIDYDMSEGLGACALGRTAAWHGVQIDPDANFAGETVIGRPGSAVEVLVLPADEELAVATEIPALLGREF